MSEQATSVSKRNTKVSSFGHFQRPAGEPPPVRSCDCRDPLDLEPCLAANRLWTCKDPGAISQ